MQSGFVVFCDCIPLFEFNLFAAINQMNNPWVMLFKDHFCCWLFAIQGCSKASSGVILFAGSITKHLYPRKVKTKK